MKWVICHVFCREVLFLLCHVLSTRLIECPFVYLFGRGLNWSVIEGWIWVQGSAIIVDENQKLALDNAATRYSRQVSMRKGLEISYKQRCKNLLRLMLRCVLNRVIIAIGFFLFTCAVLHVVSKRIGVLRLQRSVTAMVKAGMFHQAENGQRAIIDGINQARAHDNPVNLLDPPLERIVRDELWIMYSHTIRNLLLMIGFFRHDLEPLIMWILLHLYLFSP